MQDTMPKLLTTIEKLSEDYRGIVNCIKQYLIDAEAYLQSLDLQGTYHIDIDCGNLHFKATSTGDYKLLLECGEFIHINNMSHSQRTIVMLNIRNLIDFIRLSVKHSIYEVIDYEVIDIKTLLFRRTNGGTLS